METWVYDDGGRELAGFKGHTSDCVCRAIAITSGIPYKKVYDFINEAGYTEKITRYTKGRKKGKTKERTSARTGVQKKTSKQIMSELGYTWTPLMKIGQGCKAHLNADELPKGRIVAAVSNHFVAVIDGVVHDTYDCQRVECNQHSPNFGRSTRCVYGYYERRV
jgi:hypothetical protein